MKTLALILAFVVSVPTFAESAAQLRRDMVATLVEDAAYDLTSTKLTLYIDREDRESTYVRWSLNPVTYIKDGWIFYFQGEAIGANAERHASQGWATFKYKTKVRDGQICHIVTLTSVEAAIEGIQLIRERKMKGRSRSECFSVARLKGSRSESKF